MESPLVERYQLTKGEGRTKVNLWATYIGSDLSVCIHNENAHIGAVALGEYDHKTQRTTTSIITRLGHKDDVVAQISAYSISKYTKRPVCVMAGIHIDKANNLEIDEILKNTSSIIDNFLSQIE